LAAEGRAVLVSRHIHHGRTVAQAPLPDLLTTRPGHEPPHPRRGNAPGHHPDRRRGCRHRRSQQLHPGTSPARKVPAIAGLAQTVALIAGALSVTGEFRYETITPLS
jgi:hypothetical protein